MEFFKLVISSFSCIPSRQLPAQNEEKEMVEHGIKSTQC